MKRHRPHFSAARTAWHPLFIRNLRRSFPRPYFHVSAEWSLGQEPLRQDGVVVRKKDLPAGFVPRALSTLLPLLGQITLINLKGPQAVFDVDDYLHQWACAALFCRDEKVSDPSSVRLMAVAPRISERCKEQIDKRGRLLSAHHVPGISQVTGSDHLLWLVETDVVVDPLLQFFSHRARPDLRSAELLLTAAERAILTELMSDIQQFNRDPRFRLKYPDLEQVTMSMEEFAESLQAFLPIEKRLKGLPAEERLKGLPAEERFNALLASLTEDLTEEQRRQISDLLKARHRE
jgi:hypothetical protein